MKRLHYILTVAAYFIIGTGALFSQGTRCSSIKPFCAGDERLVFPNSNPTNSTVSQAETGPDYGCLARTPYPAWFYLKIGEAGNLEFTIAQTQNADGTGSSLDVDYIVWGPFSDGDDYCDVNLLTASTTIGCSYSPAPVEEMTINNARVNDIYVVLITNFEEASGFISLQQTNTGVSGSTDCSIVASDLGEDQSICGESSVVLDAETPLATEYEWYIFNDATNNFDIIPNEDQSTLTITETGRYQIIVKSDVLEAEANDEVYIEFNDLPEAITPSPIIGCSSGGDAVFDLSKVIPEITGNNLAMYSVQFYLTQEDFENSNTISNIQNFEDVSGEVVLGTIRNNATGCESTPVQVQLEASSPPTLEIPEISVICTDVAGNFISPLSIGEDLGPDFSYEWSLPNDPDGDGVQNPILILEQLPSSNQISLTVENSITGCESVFFTEVRGYSPPQEVAVEIAGSDFEGGYQVTATAVGATGASATYEYRINNGPWQQSFVFTGVQGGTHNITAREINGCGSATSPPFRLIGYPRFFTPNSDGYNDSWNVINDEERSVVKVLIFDRYGKLIKELNPYAGGWNGIFNNQPMPADDYWFLIEYREAGTGDIKQFRGNFTLKR